jgi:hypothetical protein
MKKALMTFLTIISSLNLFAQKVKLQEETPLKVKISKELSSDKAQVGDVITFTVVENLKVDGKIVIESNTEVVGEVIEAEKARSLGRPGKLDFTINSIKSVDGQIIKLRSTAKKIVGKNKTGGVIAGAVIIAPLALFIKGKNVTVEKDKEFLVFIDKDYDIEIK